MSGFPTSDTEVADRTFGGDPNPPPRLAPSGPSPERPASAESPSVSKAPPPAQEPPPAAPKATFTVVGHEDGTRSVFMSGAGFDGETKLGSVNIPDANEILDKTGSFNPSLNSWDVPEDVAKTLVSGRLAPVEFWKQEYRKGEASVVRGMTFAKVLTGELTPEQARAQTAPELLQMQLGEHPAAAWSGGFGKMVSEAVAHPLDTGEDVLRYSIGKVAGMLPALFQVGKGMAKGYVAGAAAGGAVVGGAALLVPEPMTKALALGVIGDTASAGKTVGEFKALYDMEAGGMAADMDAKGYDEATIKQIAPIAGAVKAALWMKGIDFMTAPLKMDFLKGMAESEPAQKVMASWVVDYAKAVGLSIPLGVAQEKVSQIANNMAAEAENKPELLIAGKDATDRLIGAGVDMALTVGVIHGAASALRGGVERVNTAGEAKAQAEMTKTLEARQQAGEVVPPSTEEPVKTPPPAGEPVKAAPSAAPEANPTTAGAAEDAVHAQLDLFDKGKAQPEDVTAAVDQALTPDFASLKPDVTRLDGSPENPEAMKVAPQNTLEQKTRNLETNSRVNALNSDLTDVSNHIDDLMKIRQRYLDKEMPTRVIDRQLDSLIKQEQSIKQDIEFYGKKNAAAMVTPGEDLQMKPASLENIIKEGFTEGRKEVIKTRAAAIKSIASDSNLTQADIRGLLRDKNIGLMGDVQFHNFLEDFKTKADAVVERKSALKDLNEIRAEKNLKKENYVRMLHKLPPIAKMSTEQLRSYADILSQYDANDEALSPTRVKANETTPFAGAKTQGEVRAKAAELTGKPLDAFKNVRVGEFDVNRYDTRLAERNAAANFMVNRLKEVSIRVDRARDEVLHTIDTLGAEAVSERRATMGVGARLLDWLAPQQHELMAYLEESDAAKRASLAAVLTPAERKLADFLQSQFSGAQDYLIKVGSLEEASRFDKSYVPHTRRPLPEMLKDIATGNTKIKAAVEDVLSRFMPKGREVVFFDKAGKVLGLRKFFKFSEFRSGELDPSNNVIKASKQYLTSLYDKMAVDEATPTVDTLVRSLKGFGDSPEAEELNKSLLAFTNKYLNAKKGNAEWMFQQGGMAESLLRFGQAAMSLKYIAFNAALQATIATKEGVGEFMALGNEGLAKAKFRKYTAAGKAILEKYSSFVGESPLDQLSQPGRDISDNVKMLAYGTFQFVHKTMMEDILLGNMTKEEYAKGEISDARLAAIKLDAGRWLNVHGSKSITGSTPAGATWTQLKGWAIPPLTTIAQDIGALGKQIGGGGKMTRQQAMDFVHFAQVSTVAVLVRSWVGADKEDSSFLGQAIRYTRRDLITLWQSVDPKIILSAGVLPEFVIKLGENLHLLATLEEYKHKEGLKGTAALKKQFTPSAIGHFLKEEK